MAAIRVEESHPDATRDSRIRSVSPESLMADSWGAATMISADLSALDCPVLALLPGLFRDRLATNGG
jgi:hypothetical protein